MPMGQYKREKKFHIYADLDYQLNREEVYYHRYPELIRGL